MAERWIIDQGTVSALVLPQCATLGGVRVLEQQVPDPAPRITYVVRQAGSVPSTRDYENRTVTLKLGLEAPADQWARVTHDFGVLPPEAEGDGALPGWRGTVRVVAGADPLAPMIADVRGALGRLQRDGGVLTRVLDDGRRVHFDVVSAHESDPVVWDGDYYVAGATSNAVEFECLPFGRGDEQLLGTGAPVAGKRLITLDGLAIEGDVPALARVTVDGTGLGASCRSVVVAIDRPGAVTRATGLEIPANALETTLTPTTSPPFSSAGVVQSPVLESPALVYGPAAGSWDPLVRLRIASTGLPLAVCGRFRVLLRTYAYEGSPAVRLRWAAGGATGGGTINEPYVLTAGGWAVMDLGEVTVPDGMVLDGVIERALSDARMFLDVLLLIPLESQATIAASPDRLTGPLVAFDDMQGSGSLAGSSAQRGGVWAGSGTGGSEIVRLGGVASRTDSSGNPRAVTLPVASAAVDVSVVVSYPQGRPNDGPWFGVVVGNQAGIDAVLAGSSTDAGAWAMCVTRGGSTESTNLTLDYGQIIFVNGLSYFAPALVRSQVGREYGQSSIVMDESPLGQVSVAGGPLVSFQHSPPPTSGIMAGFVHFTLAEYGVAVPVTFDDFQIITTLAADVVVPAGGSATTTTVGASRTDELGNPVPVASYRGDRPVFPPPDAAGNKARLTVGAFEADVRDGADPNPAPAVTVSAFCTPRWLQIPASEV